MNKLFTKIGIALAGVAMAVGVGVAVGVKQEAKVAEATGEATAIKYLVFPDSNSASNGLTSNQYTSTWTAKTGSDSWSIYGFNNNNWNNSWSFIRCVSKKAASTATITTSFAISTAINRVVLTIDSINASDINSITLYSSSDGSDWTSENTFSKQTGKQIAEIATPSVNKYYKISFSCKKATNNGTCQISKIEYHTNASEIATFSDEFRSNLASACSDQNANNKSNLDAIPDGKTKSLWNLQKDLWTPLSSSAKALFVTNSADTKVANAAKLYNHVVSRYGDSYAWTDVPAAGRTNASNEISSASIDSTAIIIIIVISSTALLAVGGYFLLRRKHEDR